MSKNDNSTLDYDGKDAVVTWDGRLCIHVAECGRARGDLFVTGRKPWCDPDRAPADEIVDVIERCPTGALTVRWKDGNEAESADKKNVVVIANNGPLYARGNLEIDGASDDMPGVRFRAALCRCGRSGNKPFCDNSHEDAGFRERGAIGDRGQALESEGGPLRIKRVKNGPLFVSGNLTILAGGGRAAWQGTEAVFCRCGGSQNAPFCDGTHATNGFEAD
ncbi:MAG: hypothetical protein CMM60_06115 [Rhodospirillaceae bacterium]|jgi:CDGSH-type Zn-finger protein/uncharacterized Fe-S cluster protein YjdI|nr:hypothetical protein [Rhodospirillaceae bacterium]|tara:strand:- start:37 stop:696 length:660 start_codon:yes stop_codon:yes gene_type:complete